MSALSRHLSRKLRRARPEALGPFETPRRRRDPSPSRWRYRLDRLGRRGYVRFALRRVAPPAALALLALWAWQSQSVREMGLNLYAQAREAVAERPEFAVTRLEMEGGTDELRGRIARQLGLAFPISSLDLDLAELRIQVEGIPGVASAAPRILPDGSLRLELAQRAPVALWRWEGRLHLVDRDGVIIAPVAHRALRPDLPLVLGDGADRAMSEALVLWARAAPLNDRLRGLIRMGERRWTLALSSGILVHLPEDHPEEALRRLLALDRADDLLEREVSVIDLRDPERPTLRLTERAVTELERVRAMIEGEEA